MIVSTCVFSEVQGVHRGMTGIGAEVQSNSRGTRASSGVSHRLSNEIDVNERPHFDFLLVKIAHTRGLARDLKLFLAGGGGKFAAAFGDRAVSYRGSISMVSSTRRLSDSSL